MRVSVEDGGRGLRSIRRDAVVTKGASHSRVLYSVYISTLVFLQLCMSGFGP